MSEQQFFVSKGRTIRGPITDRKKSTVNGKVQFNGTPGKVYTSHNPMGDVIALPAGFVDYAKVKKESNGQTLLQNLIEDGSIVFEAGGQSPIQFATPMPVNLTATGGTVTVDPKGGK